MEARKTVKMWTAAISFALISSPIIGAVSANETGMASKDISDKAPAMRPDDGTIFPSDTKITQKIRQSLMKDKMLSSNAKNVQITTIKGNVTLKGQLLHLLNKSALMSIQKWQQDRTT